MMRSLKRISMMVGLAVVVALSALTAGPVSADFNCVGGNIPNTGGDVFVTGNCTLPPGNTVTGNISVFSGSVTVLGVVGGSVISDQALGGFIAIINGLVGGNVEQRSLFVGSEAEPGFPLTSLFILATPTEAGPGTSLVNGNIINVGPGLTLLLVLDIGSPSNIIVNGNVEARGTGGTTARPEINTGTITVGGNVCGFPEFGSLRLPFPFVNPLQGNGYNAERVTVNGSILASCTITPLVTPGANQTIAEGSTASLNASFIDFQDVPWTVAWNFGDGSPDEITFPTTDGPIGTIAEEEEEPTTPHLYGKIGVFTATVTVTDEDDGQGTATMLVTVFNFQKLTLTSQQLKTLTDALTAITNATPSDDKALKGALRLVLEALADGDKDVVQAALRVLNQAVVDGLFTPPGTLDINTAVVLLTQTGIIETTLGVGLNVTLGQGTAITAAFVNILTTIETLPGGLTGNSALTKSLGTAAVALAGGNVADLEAALEDFNQAVAAEVAAGNLTFDQGATLLNRTGTIETVLGVGLTINGQPPKETEIQTITQGYATIAGFIPGGMAGGNAMVGPFLNSAVCLAGGNVICVKQSYLGGYYPALQDQYFISALTLAAVGNGSFTTGTLDITAAACTPGTLDTPTAVVLFTQPGIILTVLGVGLNVTQAQATILTEAFVSILTTIEQLDGCQTGNPALTGPLGTAAVAMAGGDVDGAKAALEDFDQAVLVSTPSEQTEILLTQSAIIQTTLDELNVAPVIDTGDPTCSPLVVEVNTAVSCSGGFTDADTTNTHTAVWDWGDLTATTIGTVIESAGSGSVANIHTYTTPGVYTVKLTVTDNDRASDTETFKFVVVYDPGSGFVTGGGWIDSPANACPVFCNNATGKAKFGFVSKYKRGTTTPTGQTQFQFKAGDLNFHSTSYDWLVVAGPKAMYKGDGTVNGVAGFTFQLNAVDGQIAGGGGADKFRIKIKDSGETVIYDNEVMENDPNADPTTLLDGGSIKIHQGN